MLAPLVLVNAALLRALSLRLPNSDVLPRFVEELARRLHGALETRREEKDSNVGSNALLFLAGLYNLGGLHCRLLYELIEELVSRFGELELPLLSLLLRSVGASLRGDDPAALKQIIVQVQEQEAAHAVTGQVGSARMRAFVQMVYDLKNNKQKTREAEAQAADGALGRLQKWLRKLDAKSGASTAPFKVGWAELLEAEERGRWWLVGSAWAGRHAAGQQAEREGDGGGGGARPKKGAGSAEERLQQLATAQRMNTDLRRALFMAMMGADDYMDAAARVAKVRVKRAQQGEVARVLLACAGQEGAFNPYYALLGARLCASHRELRFALQCAYWDELKEMDGQSLHRGANLAKLLAHLLGRGALPLAMLRVVEWHDLPPRSVFFWQVFFTETLSLDQQMMRVGMVGLQEHANAELRDGVLLFVGRHLRPLILKTRPALGSALEQLVALTVRVD